MPGARKPLHLRSHAKVNLALEVLGTRDDGYHELRTLFQTISLHDDIVLRPRATKDVTILCDHPAVPTDETNLAVRAARDLQRFAGVEPRRGDHADQAHPGGGRAWVAAAPTPPPSSWGSTGCGGSASGPPASIPWPGGWARTCRIS